MNARDLFIVFALATLFAFCTAKIAEIVSQTATPCDAPEATGWEPPPVHLCPEDVKLWDCIRNASYRSDI